MIAAIGMFDGIHRGHAELLKEAKRISSLDDDVWGIISFTRSDDGAVLDQKSARPVFCDREMQIILNLFTVPDIVRLRFTSALKEMSPSQFVDMISRDLGVRCVVVGDDFRFGKDRAGTPEIMRELCEARGMKCRVVPLIRSADGGIISSTGVRRAMSDGDMEAARELLGYPFFCTGTISHGEERGRALGFPTANIELTDDRSPIARGVYACVAVVRGRMFIGSANVGRNPTFGGLASDRLEVNIKDLDEDIYGEELTVLFIKRIREERTFASADELCAQIAIDKRMSAQIAGTYIASDGALVEKFLRAASR